MSEPVRIAVVDNHRLFRDSVITTLGETADFKVIAAGECCSDAVAIAWEFCQKLCCST